MIRRERFRISDKPYAVDLASLQVREPNWEAGDKAFAVSLTAVWFRGPKATPRACIGRLWDYMSGEPPADAVEALARMDDGRYGGDCQGRWNGRGYWGAESPDLAAEHMAILRPMLERFPEIPPGFDGWWDYP